MMSAEYKYTAKELENQMRDEVSAVNPAEKFDDAINHLHHLRDTTQRLYSDICGGDVVKDSEKTNAPSQPLAYVLQNYPQMIHEVAEETEKILTSIREILL